MAINPVENETQFHYGFLIVLACCAICAGPVALTFSCAGIFYSPVSESLGVGKGTFGVYMTFLCLAMTATLSFAGSLMKKVDIRFILSASVITTAAALFAMSKFVFVYQFYVAGIFLGIANAFMLYLMTPTLISAWFKVKTGFFMGLCMAFTGVGGIIFNPIGGYIITNHGWRSAYLVFSIIALVIALPFSLFVIRKGPADKGLKAYGDTGQESQAAGIEKGVLAKAALKTPAFYFVMVFGAVIALISCVNFYLPSYASSLKFSATVAASIASASMFGNMMGKVLLGYINDKSIKLSIVFGLGCGVAGIALLLAWGAQGLPVLLTGGFLFGICYATTVTIPPMMTKSIFGLKEYSQIYSNIMIVSSLCSALGASLWGFIADGTGSFITSFAIAITLAVLAMVLGFMALSAGKKLSHD